MIEVAKAWSRRHGEAVVATGTATRPLVEAAGLASVELRLGKGSNSGVIEAADQPAGEDAHLRAFFAATRRGAVATLRYQAEARRHDLLFEPDRVHDRLRVILAEVAPDRIVADHVAFGARLALYALGVGTATMVLGHPTALSAPGELYGLPPAWPSMIQPDRHELASLTERCRESVAELADAADEFLARRAPQRRPIRDLTTTGGNPTIYVYPEALHDPGRPLPTGAVFVGSLARREKLGAVEPPRGDGPRVTVALGSFLSARGDVLATAVAAARLGGWRLALASGSTPPGALGELPPGALVTRHLPQVALLDHTDVFVHHGGNGSVTECAAAGVPCVVLPFSTDQFAAAAAIERAGCGVVLDPNALTASALRDAVDRVMASADLRERARLVAASAAGGGGAATAANAIADS
jgi:MGT family glycosyltransferase